jgi:hypothetical protein
MNLHDVLAVTALFHASMKALGQSSSQAAAQVCAIGAYLVQPVEPNRNPLLHALCR